MLKEIDRKILNVMQNGFSICERPYLKLAKELNIEEEEFIRRLKKIFKAKLIRRIGAILNTHKLGLVSSLIAMKVPDKRIKNVAQVVSSLKGVTHNYQRLGEYNLWFVLHTRTIRERKKVLSWIKRKTGLKDMIDLPTHKSFKLNVKFDL